MCIECEGLKFDSSHRPEYKDFQCFISEVSRKFPGSLEAQDIEGLHCWVITMKWLVEYYRETYAAPQNTTEMYTFLFQMLC